jgi:hypothetical protein
MDKEKYFEDVYSGCFRWIASCNNRGYGQLRIKGKLKLAHRVAWEEKHGPIQDGICVCHTCDNPECINTEHLFLATHQENMMDASRKRRMHLGEKT